MTEGYNDRLRNYIEAAIYDQAPTWESLFDGGPGQVVSVSDAAIVAAMAASRFRLLHQQDPSRCPDCGNPGDVCLCPEPNDACTCGHERGYHGNADGQTGWQARCGHPDCDCEDWS